MTYTEITDEIDFLVNTDATKFPIADKTRIINRWYEFAVGKILESDGRWQFDDTNYTTLPIATTDVNASQQDYTYAVKHLRITRMEIKNQAGQWQWLQPLDQNDVRYRSLTELSNQVGVPQYYDKLANSIFLYPRPNYTVAGGLKAYYQRMAELFVTTDTTKEPGFESIFHEILAVGPAYEYAIANNLNTNKVTLLKGKLDQLTADIKEFKSKKSKDENVRLKTYYKSYR